MYEQHGVTEHYFANDFDENRKKVVFIGKSYSCNTGFKTGRLLGRL